MIVEALAGELGRSRDRFPDGRTGKLEPYLRDLG